MKLTSCFSDVAHFDTVYFLFPVQDGSGGQPDAVPAGPGSAARRHQQRDEGRAAAEREHQRGQDAPPPPPCPSVSPSVCLSVRLSRRHLVMLECVVFLYISNVGWKKV